VLLHHVCVVGNHLGRGIGGVANSRQDFSAKSV
jgi:hypothetical protein